MADVQDTDKFLVNRSGSSFQVDASELMAEIQDDDLMLVNRAGVSYKVTGLEVKDSLGPKEEAPSMTGATLAGTGPSFSGQTYTTTLENYNPGVPEADKTMLAKVTGALSVVGETSPITGTATGPSKTIRMWRSSSLPANLQAILDGSVGTEVFGGEDVTDELLIVVNQSSAVAGNNVWQTNGTATLGLDNGTGAGDGFYDAAGTRLGGSGAYGASEWTSFEFGGTIDEAYRIPLTVGYTVFRLRATGTIGTPTFGPNQVALTLTDRKDLDNGLFKPGDVVDGHGGLSYDVVSTPTNASNYIFAPENIFDGSDSSYAAWYVDTQGGTLNITFTEQVVASSIRIKTYLTGADFTVKLNGVGSPIALTSSSETWNDITNGFTGPLTSVLVTMDSTGTGQNWFYAIEVDGTILTAEEVTVVSINPASPEMTVSGGTWSVGQTVKNTVARAPEITPITDEITGLENIVADYAKDISSGTGGTIATPENAFNNLLSDSATGPNIIFTRTFTDVTSFRINSISGGDYKVKVNDTDITVGGSDTQVWLDCMSAVTAGTVTKVELYNSSNNNLSQYLYAVEVNGENLIEGDDKTTLTFATDKDLAQFSANDDVTQDSGYTPVTSAITNVATSSVSKVKAYYSATLPSNLAEAITGTEYDLTKANTNTVENNHYLTLVCEPGCPTSGQVFKADQGPIFDMKYSGGGGNFDADGNQLDAANNPPSGPSDTTEILFSDGGTTGYIVNIQAAYTVIKTIALGTTPVVVDAAQGEESVLDLTDDKDLANFRVGDTVLVPNDATQTAEVKFVVNSPYQVDTVQYYIRSGYSDDVGTGAPPGEYVDVITVTEAGDLQLNATAYENLDGVTVELINGDPNGEGLTFSGDSATRICPATVTFGAGGGEMRIKWNKPTTTSHVIYYLWYSGKNNSTWKGNILGNGATYEVEPAKQGSVTAIGPGNTLTLDTSGFSIGETVTGPDTTPATGTVASTDPAAKTMTLSASDETYPKRWIVNAGKTVVGPTGPATRFDAYLTWSGKQVTGLSTTDPGYFQAPPDLQLQFTDPAPSGQTWDQELPAGTTIQTRVKATNASGEANSGWTNVVTPRFLRPGDALPETFAESTLRMATFDNRAAVYQGEQAMTERERLAEELRAAGLDAEEIDELLNLS